MVNKVLVQGEHVMAEVAELGWSGGCQCGAIRFHAAQLEKLEFCHCRMCQKAFGAPGAALVGSPISSFKWTRGQPAEFRSSAVVARGFCRDCGTPLYMCEDGDTHYDLAAGAFDTPEKLPHPLQQIGVESRLSWFALLPSLPEKHTTQTRDPEELALLMSLQHPDHDTATWP